MFIKRIGVRLIHVCYNHSSIAFFILSFSLPPALCNPFFCSYYYLPFLLPFVSSSSLRLSFSVPSHFLFLTPSFSLSSIINVLPLFVVLEFSPPPFLFDFTLPPTIIPSSPHTLSFLHAVLFPPIVPHSVSSHGVVFPSFKLFHIIHLSPPTPVVFPTSPVSPPSFFPLSPCPLPYSLPLPSGD